MVELQVGDELVNAWQKEDGVVIAVQHPLVAGPKIAVRQQRRQAAAVVARPVRGAAGVGNVRVKNLAPPIPSSLLMLNEGKQWWVQAVDEVSVQVYAVLVCQKKHQAVTKAVRIPWTPSHCYL